MSGVLITCEQLQERLCAQWANADGPLEGSPEPGPGHQRARIAVSIPATLKTNSGFISIGPSPRSLLAVLL